MKLTAEKLMQIIKEEVQGMDETFGRHMAGETDRAAMGYYERKIAELAELMKELYGADPMNFEGNVEQAKQMAMRSGSMKESTKGDE